MKYTTGLEKSGQLFATLLITLLLSGCAKQPPLDWLHKQSAFLPFKQILAVVNERYPDAQIFEIKFRQGRGSAYERNYRYEIKLAGLRATRWRALKIDAHDGRILSDEPFSCGLLKPCPWRPRWFSD